MKKHWLAVLFGSGIYFAALLLNHKFPYYRVEIRSLAIAGVLIFWAGVVAGRARWVPEVDGPAAIRAGTYSGVWFRLVAGLMDFMMVGLVILSGVRLAMVVLVAKGMIPRSSRLLGDTGTGTEQVVVLSIGLWRLLAA